MSEHNDSAEGARPISNDYAPPDHVIAEWAKHCDCCPVCYGKPCDGCSAGGMCDAVDCTCFNSCEDEEFEE